MSDTAAPEADQPAALPGDGLREGIVDELRRAIGDALVAHELRPNDDLWVRVATESWSATGAALRAMGFTYFCFLSGIDWLPSPYGRGEDNPDEPPPERSTTIEQGVAGGETRFQVFARVVDPVRHVGVTVKTDVADDAPAVASWHTIWAGANWHEREAHEMFGIDFLGHPDLRNLYLPGEFEGHPLRKDFPLLSRMIKPWPGIVDVEPMPADDEDGDGVADEPAGDAAAPAADAAAETAPAPAETPVEDVAEPAPVDAPADAEASAEPAVEEVAEPAPVDAPTDAEASAEPPAEASAEPPVEESAPPVETVETGEAPDGAWSPDIPIADVDGPYGLGSKSPRPDGDMPPDHPVKGIVSSMELFVPGSEGYDELEPDVWFDSETSARQAGFHSPYDEDQDDRGGDA